MTKSTVKALALTLLVIVVAIASYLLIARVVYPAWFAIQRESVEESKSFVDSSNIMLQTYMLEYARLDVNIAQSDAATAKAYRGQQRAIINKMCSQVATMEPSTIQPSTMAWLTIKGGCQ